MADVTRIQPGSAQGVAPKAGQPAASQKPAAGGASFADTLSRLSGNPPAQTGSSTGAQDVRFSNHAQKRLESRDIALTPESVNRLSDAIDKAEKRGGKSSLVMVDDLAFIVNVRERTVVTALDANHRGEGVFTQIDSVVFAEPSASESKPLINKQG